jgi:hypothetical protein
MDRVAAQGVALAGAERCGLADRGFREPVSEHGCPIAPRTYYAHLARPLPARALWDATITAVLAGYYEPDEHGRKKPESVTQRLGVHPQPPATVRIASYTEE